MATGQRGRRGKRLEQAVLSMFKQYRRVGIHAQQNHARQLADGRFVGRHDFDFQIYYQGRFMVFDAKECQAKRWETRNAKPHQIAGLAQVVKHGGEAFFLVWFVPENRLVKVGLDVVTDPERRSITSADGIKTNLDIVGAFA